MSDNCQPMLRIHTHGYDNAICLNVEKEKAPSPHKPLQEAFFLIVGVFDKANVANNMEEEPKTESSSSPIIPGLSSLCVQQVFKPFSGACSFFMESFKDFWSAWAFYRAQKTRNSIY